MKRYNTNETSDEVEKSEEIVIERDTVVSAHVKVWRGSSSMKVLKQYRVLNTHDKYYNKWFVAKDPQKVLGKDGVGTTPPSTSVSDHGMTSP